MKNHSATEAAVIKPHCEPADKSIHKKAVDNGNEKKRGGRSGLRVTNFLNL
jgi:hypothetical protein